MAVAVEGISSGLWRVMPWPYFRLTREGNIFFVNKNLTDMLGCSVGDLLERNIEEVLKPRSDSGTIKKILEELKCGNSWHGHMTYHGPKELSFELLLQIDPAEEDMIWGIVMENPVVDGQTIVSTHNELKLLKMLLDHTIDYVYFIDTSGQFVITNKAFQRALKVPYSGYEIGKRLGDFVADETRRQFEVTDQRVFDTNELLINHISFFECIDGTGHWVQSTKIPVYNKMAECIGLVCVGRDITELSDTTKKMRQAMRRAELANDAKSDFLANMSHEIRTPINGIIGMTELCMDTDMNEEQEDYLGSVYGCTQTLLRVVNDILDFSKAGAGQLEIEMIRFDLKKCMSDVFKQMNSTVDSDVIDFLIDIDDALPAYVRGDPTRLKQVLYNLINNAVKFTKEGSITISAKCSGKEYPKSNISLKIIDTGIGIAKNRQENVFKSFTQADNSTTRKYGGTGLGLSICSQLVELMDGSIDLESEEGEGTTITVNVPLKPMFEDDAVSVVEEEPKPQILKSLKILVVEDNPVNRRVVVSRLHKMGHKVSVAENGKFAVQMYQKSDFDIILMDVQMPVMDGLAATTIIREMEAASGKDEHVPIVAMTARALKSDKDICRDAGMDNYISKPFHSERLKNAINEVMSDEPIINESSNAYENKSRGKSVNFSEMLSNLGSEDREDMIDAGGVYLEYFQKEIDDLNEAIDSGLFDCISALAHKVKGGLGALQDWRAFDEAKILEDFAEGKDEMKVKEHMERLEKRMYVLADEIRTEVK